MLNREAGKVNGNPHERMSAYLITNNLTDHHEFIEHRLGRFIKNIGSKEENPLISDTKMLMQELQPVIEISNTRQQTIITKNQGQDGVHEEVYEMAFDDVSYHNVESKYERAYKTTL